MVQFILREAREIPHQTVRPTIEQEIEIIVPGCFIKLGMRLFCAPFKYHFAWAEEPSGQTAFQGALNTAQPAGQQR